MLAQRIFGSFTWRLGGLAIAPSVVDFSGRRGAAQNAMKAADPPTTGVHEHAS
jgi:hypothetical protein